MPAGDAGRPCPPTGLFRDNDADGSGSAEVANRQVIRRFASAVAAAESCPEIPVSAAAAAD